MPAPGRDDSMGGGATQPARGDMQDKDFRRAAHELVDWMADYLTAVETYPVRARVQPGDILAELAETPPDAGEPMAAIFDDFKNLILPGMTHWQHPSFFGYFPANSSPPSVLAEMLTATLGAQCMSWQTSPAATELEQRMMAWLAAMFGLDGFEGVIQDSASSATLCAILTARERATDWRVNETGLAGGPALTVYCSSECHSSIEKDVKIAGLGRANLRQIAVDETYAMDPDNLAAAIEADIAAGNVPICVIAAIGTTGSSAIDPLPAIAEICARHGIWLHVDAAWAGAALILPEHRWMIDGIESADSLVINPHKWLFTNFDCTAYFVRDPAALVRTLEILPEFLKTPDDAERNYRDWSVPLGRRFRALKLWFVIRSYGVDGLKARIAAHIAMAQALAREIGAAENFELMAPVPLALICFRCRPVGWRGDLDRLNETIVARINDSGEAFLTHTRLAGAYVMRLSIGQTTTEQRHVDRVWQLIQDTARAVAAETTP